MICKRQSRLRVVLLAAIVAADSVSVFADCPKPNTTKADILDD